MKFDDTRSESFVRFAVLRLPEFPEPVIRRANVELAVAEITIAARLTRMFAPVDLWLHLNYAHSFSSIRFNRSHIALISDCASGRVAAFGGFTTNTSIMR